MSYACYCLGIRISQAMTSDKAGGREGEAALPGTRPNPAVGSGRVES
jgi:hypothetical protein